MKILMTSMLGILLCGCASTEKGHSDDTFEAARQAPATHQEKAGAKEAAIGVALATTLGVINKETFTCTKACEKALKESLAGTQYK